MKQTILIHGALWISVVSSFSAAKPNVLFIAIDDLNDWIGCLGGHPQARTPNLDRLAASGVLFTNAHCPAPACNPSRTAIFTGQSPHRSGLYANNQSMREILPKAELLPKNFSHAGYWAAGSGKMLHYFIDARSWDEYFPKKETENPFPRTLYPKKRPVSIPREPWQYVETDWAALEATDEEYGGDVLVADWVGKQLARKHDKPFFLACGIYRPHEPWFVPKKYFAPFPLESIQLPLGYKADDLDDLPPEGKRRGPNRYFAHIQKHQQWKAAVQGYLASIYFADTMLGRVLDALEKGPNAGNTIVVLWSDHGWHLGEKQHWQNSPLGAYVPAYRSFCACPRAPLACRLAARRQQQTRQPAQPCAHAHRACRPAATPGPSRPEPIAALKNPKADWPHVAITHLAQPGSFGLSAERFRYIRYAGGDEELYDILTDPHEWRNLARDGQHADTLRRLRALAPNEFATAAQPSLDAMPSLKWVPLKATAAAPASKPIGGSFDVIFVNRRPQPVQLFWMTLNGDRRHYATIEPGKTKRQRTRPGAVWQIADGTKAAAP